MSKEIKIPFNKWSETRIRSGDKICTSRHEKYGEPGDYFWVANIRCQLRFVTQLPLWFVRDFLCEIEGAKDFEEFEKVWRKLHRGKFKENELVWVHFFSNPLHLSLIDYAVAYLNESKVEGTK